jgi:DNA-binding transcriptional LysR family regulator
MSMNFALLDLRVFLAVFDHGNFHLAAERLNMSQPALSRRLRTLEVRLGTTLFERSTRSVKPTTAGSQLEAIARRVLDDLDGSILSMNKIGERQSGLITISSIPAAAIYFLPKAIKHFNRQYPHIRLRVLDRSPQEALECVISGEAEFGINMIGSTERDVTFTPVMEDPYVLACHRNHPLARARSLTWHSLEGFPLIRIGRDNSGNRALLDSALSKANVRLDWFHEVNNLTTSLGLVEADLGATVLPRLATPHGRHPTVVIKPIRSPEVSRTVGIIEPRKTRMSPAARLFRDLLLVDWRSLLVGGKAVTPRSSKRPLARRAARIAV